MKTGPAEAIIGAFMLVAFSNPIKKNAMFMVIPKNAEVQIITSSLKVIFCQLLKITGMKIREAKKPNERQGKRRNISQCVFKYWRCYTPDNICNYQS